MHHLQSSRKGLLAIQSPTLSLDIMHSCFLSDITQAFENNSQVDTIYLDFQKAFDRVSHQELLRS